MKIQLIHISDIHLKDDTKGQSSSAQTILNRLREKIEDFKKFQQEIIIVITGDIAYSGKKEEYSIAEKFLKSILEDNSKIKIVLIPGNHDNDYIRNSPVRKILLANIENDYHNINEEVLEQVLKVQEEFFNFHAKFNPLPRNKLYWSQTINLESGERLSFNLFNTGWSSTLDSNSYGKILFPLVDLNNNTPDIVISCLHHPFEWFNPDIRENFKDVIEENSDIILTGHEHRESNFNKNDKVTYFSSGALFCENFTESKFNVIEIDTVRNNYTAKKYEFHNDKFVNKSTNETKKFLREERKTKKTFSLERAFREQLNNTLTTYSHPYKENIQLNDIFIFPILKNNSFHEKEQLAEYIKNKDEVFEQIKTNNLITILGDQHSGKSSLLSIIFSYLHDEDFTPIKISGSDLKKELLNDKKNIEKLFNRVLSNSYSNINWQSYQDNVKKDMRVLIVDDFPDSNLNSIAKERFTKEMKEFFDKIILTGEPEVLKYEILKERSVKDSIFNDISIFEILPLNRFKIDQLVTKWIRLGREHIITSEQELNEKDHATRAINLITEKNLVPNHPFYILAMLQQMEAGIDHNLVSSSYSYIYDYFIKRTLQKKTSWKIDFDTFTTFVSALTHDLFIKKQKVLTELKFTEFLTEHNRKYDLKLNYNSIKDQLIDCGALVSKGAYIEFNQDYFWYYFVAKHISDHLNKDPKIKDTVVDLCKNLHLESNANIVAFIGFFSKDPFIIETITNTAINIFSDLPPCDFESSVSYLNKIDLDSKLEEAIYAISEKTPEENRENLNHNLDQIEQDEKKEKDKNEEVSEHISMFNKSQKTIQVIGQILRSFHGSLEAENKRKLTIECFNLGLRSLTFFMKSLEETLPKLIEEIANEMIKNKKNVDKKTLEARFNSLVFLLSELISAGIIKKISYNIGSPNLEMTFNEVLKKNDSIGIHLINTEIRMTFFDGIPTDDIISLYNKIKNNKFSSGVLKRLLINYMTYNHVNFKDKQKLCSHLNISLEVLAIKKQKYIENTNNINGD